MHAQAASQLGCSRAQLYKHEAHVQQELLLRLACCAAVPVNNQVVKQSTSAKIFYNYLTAHSTSSTMIAVAHMLNKDANTNLPCGTHKLKKAVEPVD